MTRVRIDLNISLDGIAKTADQTPDDPFGQDWGRLTEHYVATRTFRSRVLRETDGSGTTGVDDRYGAHYFAGIGAEVMGAGMFGLHDHADDPEWRGWWGDEPPFECPVFVLTHAPRESLHFANGTAFHFVSGSPAELRDRAVAVAGGRDVRVGGGVSVARDFLRAGLVDDLHVAIVPIVIGAGVSLWDDLRRFEDDYEVTTEGAPLGVSHVTFRRRTP